MLALTIILILLAAVLLIPLGVRVKYDDAGFGAWASVSAYKLRLYPPKKKADEPPTEADVPKQDKPKRRFSPGFSLQDWLTLAGAGLRALKRFKNGISFGLIRFYCVISADDPYDAVMRYNRLNGLIGSAIPFFENGFKVRKKDIFLDLDLEGEKSRFQFEITARVRVGRLLAIALAAGFSFVKLLIKNRVQRIRERKARNGKQQIERNDAVDHAEYQEPC